MLTAKFLQKDSEGLLAEVDLGIYSASALMKVVYKFTDRCFVHLQHRSERIVEVRFRAKGGQIALETIAGEFCNELLDQGLREIISRESETTRNLVLAHALSRSQLANPESNKVPSIEPPPQNDARS